MNETEINIIEIYCDESGHELLTTSETHRQNRYFGIGAIKINSINRVKFKNDIKAIKDAHHIPWELKWRKLTRSNLDFYKAIVDWFVKSDIQFRLIRIDTAELDLEFWHQRDPELGFYKFYYQCLKHILCENAQYRIFTDYKTNRDKDRLKRLKFFLNFYSGGYVRDIQALESGDSIFIQLADLFTGAIVASHNQKFTSQAKIEFCSYLAKKLDKPNLTYCSTRFGDPKFNIFFLEFGRIS